MTLPVRPALRAVRESADTVTPLQLVALQAVPLAAGISYQIGLPDASASPVLSHGPGAGGGVGDGSGTGIGSGVGPGYGPGSGGGFGGGARRPGNGVTAPTLLTQVKPLYTNDAMQRKIQGAVVLDVVVAASGAPSQIRIVRSLDQYGLDQEAIRAVRQWRFNPGRLGQIPVDVLVTVVIDFHIR
jgi:TonB family protein